MPGGGSKPGQRRGGRKPGTPNKLPKGERALVKLDAAEREVRVIVVAGKPVTELGKDRLAELDQWAYALAQKYAPKEKDGKLHWDNDGDELRFMRFTLPPPKPSMGETRWRHLSAGTATSAYCCSMPASRITLVQRSVSSFLSFAMSAGLPPPGRRCSCRYRSLTSGSSSVALTARLSLAMMAAGVFGGALMAFQVSERNPGTPASITVGMSGRSSSLRSVATARILAFPPVWSL